jgi:hypothetical protein
MVTLRRDEPGARTWLASVRIGFDDGVRAWEHQALVTVVEHHHIGWSAVLAADLDDLPDPVGQANGSSVNVKSVTYLRVHEDLRRRAVVL